MEYVFNVGNAHGTFTPSGRSDIAPQDVDQHNRELESKELEYIKTAPQNLYLYIKQHTAPGMYVVITWLGTPVSDTCEVGDRQQVGFGFHTYRRSVRAIIHGVRYVGIWPESSGEYVRLRKAKRQ